VKYESALQKWNTKVEYESEIKNELRNTKVETPYESGTTSCAPAPAPGRFLGASPRSAGGLEFWPAGGIGCEKRRRR